jgi:hypothetical protein
MGKSDCRELLTLAVELALMAETRYRPLPSLYVELATKIHDVIGDDETSIVSCSCNCLPFIYIINVLSPTWSRSCKHFVAKLGTAGIFN